MNRVAIRAEAIESPRWLGSMRTFAMQAMEQLGIDGLELSIVVCDDALMRQLNRRYRGQDATTDVLSFEQPGLPIGKGRRSVRVAGDVIISLPAAAANALHFMVEEEEELKRLIIHGILHLTGMNHETNLPEEPMLELQEQVLHSLLRQTAP
jgi:probable rRNA maturation factor